MLSLILPVHVWSAANIVTAVPGGVGFELRHPESSIPRRRCGCPASAMSVPKAPVNEEGTPPTRATDVRGPWKSFRVRPERVAQVPHDCPNRQFRLGATLPHFGHEPSPLWSCRQAFHRRHPWGIHATPATVYHDSLLCRVLFGGRRTVCGP